jgi:hypothetical protein
VFVTKKLGVSLGRSATSQQVLKMKIDGAPRRSEPTLESAVWQATSRKAREKWPTHTCFGVKTNPRYTSAVTGSPAWSLMEGEARVELLDVTSPTRGTNAVIQMVHHRPGHFVDGADRDCMQHVDGVAPQR